MQVSGMRVKLVGLMLTVRNRELREFPHETQGIWPRWKADALYRWKAGQKAERTPSEAQEAFNDQMGKGRYSRISDIRG